VFLVLGVGFRRGERLWLLLKTIPDAVLGGLLMFSRPSSWRLSSKKPQDYRRR